MAEAVADEVAEAVEEVAANALIALVVWVACIPFPRPYGVPHLVGCPDPVNCPHFMGCADSMGPWLARTPMGCPHTMVLPRSCGLAFVPHMDPLAFVYQARAFHSAFCVRVDGGVLGPVWGGARHCSECLRSMAGSDIAELGPRCIQSVAHWFPTVWGT